VFCVGSLKKAKVKQNQPKTHALKSRVACKLRRKKIIKALAEGKTNKQAGIEAGLNPNTAHSQVSQILNEPNVQSSFKALLDAAVPDKLLTAKYNQLLESKKVISAMVVDDCAVQLKCADSISKLKGHLIDNIQHSVSGNLADLMRQHIAGNCK
jgi:DNA-binding CsgD family transcriptional regulator